MEEQANILSAQQLCIGYKTGHGHVKQVHGDLSFSLRKGELTCLLGANGSGKSTLLRTLSASQPSLSGKILLNGNELSVMSEREISRQIGVVLTDKTQTGGLTVYELVALGRQPHTGFFGKLDRQDRQVVDEAIEAVGISHKAHSYMAQLSDGEKQKAMIAKVPSGYTRRTNRFPRRGEPHRNHDSVTPHRHGPKQSDTTVDSRHRTSAGARRLPMAFTEGARNA